MTEQAASTKATNDAPADRFCDLVMKGGVTSGIVYPPAISALAEKYRFKNIGGTSAGAIAAAVTAAAEYQRRHSPSGSTAGFALLADLPNKLSNKEGTGKTKLLRLFQPDPPGRRLFRLLVGSLNAKSAALRVLWIVLNCIVSYWLGTVLALFAASLAYYCSGSALATVLSFLIAELFFLGVFVYRDVTRGVVRNNYGLCKGMTTKKKEGTGLTDWLHEMIQTAAGRESEGDPLTFGDLWHSPGSPAGGGGRSIDLQMFTTNLTHGRPYILPHEEPTARLFFKAEEIKEYLPAQVFDWFIEHAKEYTEERRSTHSDPEVAEAKEKKLLEIPDAVDFPILLAARMSLSFPLLFAAVPLWAIDYEEPRGHRTFRRCLFSDGGISSNFPMHLFDGLLPSWPTFGIQLEPALPGYMKDIDPEHFKNLIFLPHEYGQGIADRWNRFDQENNTASKMGGFLTSIVATMQNWNDNMLSRMPGVRDRVVRVRLLDDEGGMNLDMKEDLIKRIAKRGEESARRLIKRFAEPPLPENGASQLARPSLRAAARARVAASKTWQGWDFQRFVRLDVLLRTFADKASGLCRALGDHVPHATPYTQLVERAAAEPPPGHPDKLTPDQADALRALLSELKHAASTFDDTAPEYPNEPIPNPDLRVRPSL